MIVCVVYQDVFFAEDGVSDAAEAASKIQGKVVLVENIRFHPGEEGITDGPGGCRVKVSYDVLEEFRCADFVCGLLSSLV